jgi:hypothetical protein
MVVDVEIVQSLKALEQFLNLPRRMLGRCGPQPTLL